MSREDWAAYEHRSRHPSSSSFMEHGHSAYDTSSSRGGFPPPPVSASPYSDAQQLSKDYNGGYFDSHPHHSRRHNHHHHHHQHHNPSTSRSQYPVQEQRSRPSRSRAIKEEDIEHSYSDDKSLPSEKQGGSGVLVDPEDSNITGDSSIAAQSTQLSSARPPPPSNTNEELPRRTLLFSPSPEGKRHSPEHRHPLLHGGGKGTGAAPPSSSNSNRQHRHHSRSDLEGTPAHSPYPHPYDSHSRSANTSQHYSQQSRSSSFSRGDGNNNTTNNKNSSNNSNGPYDDYSPAPQAQSHTLPPPNHSTSRDDYFHTSSNNSTNKNSDMNNNNSNAVSANNTPRHPPNSRRGGYPIQSIRASRLAYEQNRNENKFPSSTVSANSSTSTHVPKSSPMYDDRYHYGRERGSGDANTGAGERRVFGDLGNTLDQRGGYGGSGNDPGTTNSASTEEHANFGGYDDGSGLHAAVAVSRRGGTKRRATHDPLETPYSNEPYRRMHSSPTTTVPGSSSAVRYCTPIVTNERSRAHDQDRGVNTYHPSPVGAFDDPYDSHLRHYHRPYPSMRSGVTGAASPTRYEQNSPQHRHRQGNSSSSPHMYATPVLRRSSSPRIASRDGSVPYPNSSYHPHGANSDHHNKENYPYNPPSSHHYPPISSAGYYSPTEYDRHPASDYRHLHHPGHDMHHYHPLHDSKRSRMEPMKAKTKQPATKPPRRKKMYSDFVGVTYNKTHAKFQACITHYRKQHYLGRYKLAVDAARAYDESAKLLKGSGWKINFQSMEEYESAKMKEIEENEKKRGEGKLVTGPTVAIATPKINVPLSVQETVAAESAGPLKRLFSKDEDTELNDDGENSNLNVTERTSHQENSNFDTSRNDIQDDEEKSLPILTHKPVQEQNVFDNKDAPVSKEQTNNTSAVTPSPHPQVKSNTMSLLQEPIMTPLGKANVDTPLQKALPSSPLQSKDVSNKEHPIPPSPVEASTEKKIFGDNAVGDDESSFSPISQNMFENPQIKSTPVKIEIKQADNSNEGSDENAHTNSVQNDSIDKAPEVVSTNREVAPISSSSLTSNEPPKETIEEIKKEENELPSPKKSKTTKEVLSNDAVSTKGGSDSKTASEVTKKSGTMQTGTFAAASVLMTLNCNGQPEQQ